MKTIISAFKHAASITEQAIVLIFDLEGFSKFFSHPDINEYVPKLLNLILGEIDATIKGEKPYWAMDIDDEPIVIPAFPELIHSKFLGDGALYIWRYNDFTEQQRLDLISTFWLLKLKYKRILKKATDEIPFPDIPKNIRFGIAAGTIHQLTYQHSENEEYIGYSINLASRLQNYCSDIGFIVSGRLNISSADLEGGQYVKVVAQKIKGFPEEIVIIDKKEYEALAENIKTDLFKPFK